MLHFWGCAGQARNDADRLSVVRGRERQSALMSKMGWLALTCAYQKELPPRYITSHFLILESAFCLSQAESRRNTALPSQSRIDRPTFKKERPSGKILRS